MIVRIGEHRVDVNDEDCEHRPCFALGFDNGPYTPGVGYTRPETVPRAVCFQRHLSGCPHTDSPLEQPCGTCRGTGLFDEEECYVCRGAKVLLVGQLLPPRLCCDNPRVPRTRPGKPLPFRQKCLGCGTLLKGKRLVRVRELSG